MRAIGYTRRSDAENESDDLMVRQTDAITHYAAAKGWTLVRIYSDPDNTGRNADRPGYRTMIRDAVDYDVILFLRLDRLHRNRREWDDFACKQWNIAFPTDSLVPILSKYEIRTFHRRMRVGKE